MTTNDQKTRYRAVCGLMTMFMMLAVIGYAPAMGIHRLVQDSGKIQKVPSGQKTKLFGIVITRQPDSFTLRDNAGVESVVVLTPLTSVTTFRKGAFRGPKTFGVSYILRGLRLEAQGTGNDQGQLIAETIKFEEKDLETAQSLAARVDPVEALAKSNQEKLAAAEERERKLAQEVAANKAAAAKAQASADEARKSADLAHDRINGLDDFDSIRTITVNFATGKATLGPKGKATIDQAAAWVKTQDRNGWVVAVIGYADKTGKSAANRRLSAQRADSVIDYLVKAHHLPLQRLVQPFGYGEEDKNVDESAEGLAKSRRVEIRLLANKGIAGGAKS